MPSHNKDARQRQELTNALQHLRGGILLDYLLRRCSPDFLLTALSPEEVQAITAEAADLAASIEGLRLALLAPAAQATTSSQWQAPARVSPLTLTPLAIDGDANLGAPIRLELAPFTVDFMPVNRVRAGTLSGSRHVVILSTSEHEYAIAGADYLRIVRGEQPLTRDEVGCLAAALHQAREFPISLIGDACDLCAPRQGGGA